MQHLPQTQKSHQLLPKPNITQTNKSTFQQNIQQLTINILIEMKESLKAARLWDKMNEKKYRRFHKLPPHRKQLILNAFASSPFTELADTLTKFYESILAKKSAFKVKQLIDHELSNTNVKRFKFCQPLPPPSG